MVNLDPSSDPRPAAGARKRRQRKAPGVVRGRVKPHDPFELIRWLAMSQPDPRKALAELVQNSLDAEARRVRVTRVREKGVACLRIHDDGRGVIPEMDREKALEYIATHIGHSRKRALSPQERMELMTQGQYGIGLLGFWSLGHRLEIRSSVPGQTPRRLVLHRDDPHYDIEFLRGRLPLEERWTEVVVVGLHREAQAALAGRRAADYLAAELRGQLLGRSVDLVVEDRMSRGLSPKSIQVRPQRFLGERIPLPEHVEVPGYSPMRLEIYLANGESTGENPVRLGLYAAGTLVAESFQALGALGLDREPWIDTRLTGMIDFADFHVAPGSRRGVIVDEAGAAFAAALSKIEPALVTLLDNLERRKAEKLDRTLIRDLQRAFRDFYRQRPRYAMLPVHEAKDESVGGDANGAGRGAAVHARDQAAGDASAAESGELDAIVPEPAIASLLPAGPLAAVRVAPARVRVECGDSKRLRAVAVDETGRALECAVEFEWHADGAIGTLAPAAPTTVAMDEGAMSATPVTPVSSLHVAGPAGRSDCSLRAANIPGEGRVVVTASADGRAARAEIPVAVLAELPNARPSEGIPEPEFVSQPGAAWRSRMSEGRWQVNSGHRDYLAAAEKPTLKLRYLALLFAKEIVVRSHQDPRLEQPLEQVIEVATFADTSLAGRGRPVGSKTRG
jgi:hypothetical protein